MTYTDSLEAQIVRQTAEIADLKARNQRAKNIISAIAIDLAEMMYAQKNHDVCYSEAVADIQFSFDRAMMKEIPESINTYPGMSEEMIARGYTMDMLLGKTANTVNPREESGTPTPGTSDSGMPRSFMEVFAELRRRAGSQQNKLYAENQIQDGPIYTNRR